MPTQSGKRSDLPTMIAVAVVAYAASSVVHELIGHGIGCLLTGVKALRFTSIIQCPRWDWCFLSVSETVGIHRLSFFLWLFAATNLLVATAISHFYSGL